MLSCTIIGRLASILKKKKKKTSYPTCHLGNNNKKKRLEGLRVFVFLHRKLKPHQYNIAQNNVVVNIMKTIFRDS